MPTCPTCMGALQTIRQRAGIYFLCGRCNGRAVTVPQVRQVAGDKFATQLLRKINTVVETSARSCPFCNKRMKQFQIEQPVLTLDACRQCNLVWFDPSEFEEVPQEISKPPRLTSKPPPELTPRAQEAVARWEVERMAERRRYQEIADGSPPDEGWKWLPGFFGLPVEINEKSLSLLPWLTYSLAAIIVLISVFAFSDLENAVQRFGLIPAEMWRHGGATLLTSFFLHGGVWHLIGNMYFFMIFGDNVEDYLGRRRFVGLLLLSTLVGDCLHILADPYAMRPCIGASGGIAGVLAFYALEFPHARLGLMLRLYWRFRWIQIPACVAFVLWMLLQFIGALKQLSGFSNVSSLAHIGGAATGFGMWLWWRRIGRAATNG